MIPSPVNAIPNRAYVLGSGTGVGLDERPNDITLDEPLMVRSLRVSPFSKA